MTSLTVWAVIRLLLVCSLFFPLIRNEAERYPVHLEGAQSVSVLLGVWGAACGEVKAKMVGSVLHVWSEEDCDRDPFYLQTGFYWAREVCSMNECIEVRTP